jgi:drug/metabolite transporter (DMT)-like permease
VLAYSSAGFTAVLGWRLFKESLGLPKIAAVVLSLGGCVMVANAYDPAVWQLQPLGVTTGLVSGLGMALYSLMGREAAHRRINSWTALFYSFAFGAVFILVFNQFPGIPGAAGSLRGLLPGLPLGGWLVLVALSFGPTVLGYGLYTASMNYIQASIANLLATLEPVMTAVQAYWILGERMSAIQIVGSLVILGAVVIVQFEREMTLVVEPVV